MSTKTDVPTPSLRSCMEKGGTWEKSSGNSGKRPALMPKPGTRKGHGTFYYFNGDRYVGKWKRDKPEGKGIYYYTNGDR